MPPHCNNRYGDDIVAIMSVHVYKCVCVFVCVTAGEACWWTIHPASKQRSEGEKVRIGDDLILVSLSSERYLVSLLATLSKPLAESLGVIIPQ